MMNFLEELTAAMNATIVRRADSETIGNGHAWVAAERDGVRFHLSAHPAGYRFKVPTAIVGPDWPRDSANHMHDIRNCYGLEVEGLKIDHRAQAAVSRGAEAVAKDFGRRFLPLYTRAYVAACKRRDEADAYATAKSGAAAGLAAISPGLFKVEGEGSNAKVRWCSSGGARLRRRVRVGRLRLCRSAVDQPGKAAPHHGDHRGGRIMAYRYRKANRSMAASVTADWLAKGAPVSVEFATVPPCCECGRVPSRGYHRVGAEVQCLSPDSECMRLSDLRRDAAGDLNP